MRTLLVALVLAACGGPSSTPQAPKPKPASLPPGEVKSCGDGCERKAACHEASWGTPMSPSDIATCEETCLTLAPDDADPYLEALSAATDCAEILELAPTPQDTTDPTAAPA